MMRLSASEAQQGDKEALKQVAMEAAPDGVLLVGRDGRILLVNPAMCAMSGFGSDELAGQPLDTLLPPEAREAHERQVASYFHLPTGRAMGQGRELWLLCKGGRRVPVDISLGHSPLGGGVAVVFVRDLSPLREIQERMRYQATHDILTGLLNRWQFGLQMERAMSQAGGDDGAAPFALVLLDLDDFKVINDSYGYDVGDGVLKEVAHRLRTALGASATLARMGSDEFMVLIDSCRDEAMLKFQADTLLWTLCQPYTIGRFALNLGASAGIALFPQDANNPVTLMRYADMAMSQAKQRGRPSCVRYSAAMGRSVSEKVTLHGHLKRALAAGRLCLHYQPQVLAGGAIQGVEALLRWYDAELGWVSPERFVPVAEQTGLILAVGDWVIEAACRQAGEWLRAGTPLRVAINLSPQQLRQADLRQRLLSSLGRHGVPPHLLELEVTESAAMTDPLQARELLESLLADGLCVVLDDFGTGYSSLVHLRDLPVSRVKIDRTFIGAILQSEADAKIVKAVVGLVKALDLEVVAEGVENLEQLRQLEQLGCDAYQGWLFARAVPAQQISLLVLQQQRQRPADVAPA